MIMQSHPLLFVYQRSRRSQLDHDHSKQHYRRKQNNCNDRSENIHQPFYHRIERIGQRHITDIDDRKSQNILCIRLGWDNLIIVRDKLRVYS